MAGARRSVRLHRGRHPLPSRSRARHGQRHDPGPDGGHAFRAARGLGAVLPPRQPHGADWQRHDRPPPRDPRGDRRRRSRPGRSRASPHFDAADIASLEVAEKLGKAGQGPRTRARSGGHERRALLAPGSPRPRDGRQFRHRPGHRAGPRSAGRGRSRAPPRRRPVRKRSAPASAPSGARVGLRRRTSSTRMPPEALAREVTRAFGPVDILIANAAIEHRTPWQDAWWRPSRTPCHRQSRRPCSRCAARWFRRWRRGAGVAWWRPAASWRPGRGPRPSPTRRSRRRNSPRSVPSPGTWQPRGVTMNVISPGAIEIGENRRPLRGRGVPPGRRGEDSGRTARAPGGLCRCRRSSCAPMRRRT